MGGPSTVVVQGRQSAARPQPRSPLMTRQLDLTVQGVVGTNPVLSRVGDNARPYCRFRVAVTPTYRTDQGWNNAETIWFTAKAWGQLAANLSHSLRKGDAVLLTGRFSQESWENNGRKHETNVITLQAAGHDLTRGESRFARVRAVWGTPSTCSSRRVPLRARESRGVGALCILGRWNRGRRARARLRRARLTGSLGHRDASIGRLGSRGLESGSFPGLH